MADACPISSDRVDDRAGRIAAFLSLAFMAIFAWRGWIWAILALALDFALRAAGWRRISPIAQGARMFRRLFQVEARPINAGPKRFAAAVGCLFSLGVFTALLLQHRTLGLALAAGLVLAAGLEAALGFCIACRIYPFLPFRGKDPL